MMNTKMKALIWMLLFPVLSVLADEKPVVEDKPKVEVYLIRKMEVKEDGPMYLPATILEVSNPTKETYFVRGMEMESPFYDVEVKRGEKWLLPPGFRCGTGSELFPLKPGAKMLMTVNPPWDEEASRFRFYFFTTDDEKTMKVVTVRSRAIEKKELGDLTGTTGEVNSEKKDGFEEPRTDEELNKEGASDEGAKDPFGE